MMQHSTGNSNGLMSTSTTNNNNNANNGQSNGSLKAYFKTPEGRYKLQYEKTHPPGLLHYAHGKTVTQVTIAYLKEKSAQLPLTPTSSSSSTSSGGGGVRSAAARLLGSANGSRALSFVGGNGTSKAGSGFNPYSHNRINSSSGGSSASNMLSSSNFDGKGTYLIFNVGDTIYISDYSSQDKDPIKSIHFSTSNPVCHAFDPEAKDGHDLVIGLNSGDVYSVSLRQQLQDVGKKLVGAQHYNKDCSVNSRQAFEQKPSQNWLEKDRYNHHVVLAELDEQDLHRSGVIELLEMGYRSRCASVAWVPEGDGAFIVAHADGNLYVYEKSKDGSGDSSFPVIKDQTQFSVAHAKSSKSNPIARWHICQGSINSISFSTDGTYLATVGRDGYLRVFDYLKEQLICGGKSYYGALLCCAWSMDGKYILTGGEDDLVQVWSMDDRKVVAWGEGHNSWVSGVAFDSYWTSPTSDGTEENVMYRFGSVGQDTQLLLWDLVMDELVVPLRRGPPGGSPTFSTGSQSSHWDNICPVGTLQPAPSMRDVPKLSPLVAHRVHNEPLSGLVFTQESVLTACREGHVKIWMRPGYGESHSGNSESALISSSKEKPLILNKVGSSSYKQQSISHPT
ncbi:hypothetical protein IFM89_019740 [Coptis chinensis]|uniref:Uncharacterized protein n=1 Tax=Coptis chinensis TaxID=261450 RepID=A0A835H7I3_9MAGN|nr:hypothetical protein IFM89_019740 [Coptis chinensis]